MSRPKIAITMGDPAGVGPEICLDLLQNKQVADLCIPIVFGDSGVMKRCAEKTGRPTPGSILGLTELRTSKDQFPEEEYFQALEKICLEIARLYQQTDPSPNNGS